MLKKLLILFLVLLLLLISSLPFSIFSEGVANITILSVLRNKNNEITVILNSSGINDSEDVSVLLTNSQGNTNTDDIIYITQTKVTQDGYSSIVLPIDEERVSESESYIVRIGFESKSGYVQKAFSGTLTTSINEFIKVQPSETSEELLSKFKCFDTAEVLNAENTPFEGILENNFKINCFINNITFNYTAIVAGDCNGDNVIGASDALLALQQSVNKITLGKAAFFAGDINQNGSVEAADALLILQYSVNKINVL